MKNKQLRVIVVVVLALILTVAGLTTKTMLDSIRQFNQDGYVLVPSRDTAVTTNVNEQYYFSAGTKWRTRYGETIRFKDTSNQEVSMSKEEFVHYNDGSMGSFTKGVVMDLVEIGDNQVTYYGVSDKTTILKQGNEYSMSYLGNSLTLNEFIWKIADDTFMLVSPSITVHLADGIEVTLEDYVQVQYVAGGIARLVHQRGTYQTVSDDAFIQTDSGFQLKLTERAFYNGLEKAVSLDEMVIDSSSNLMIDENEQELKIPTFRVVNGKDGSDGSDGFTGEDGQDGEAGGNGTTGENGSKGQNGFDGLEGDSGEWGYDGQVGKDGKDAENSAVTDGIVGIVQESAPTIAMDPDSYKLGTNSVAMNLKISDPNGLLTADDLECVIYKRDDMTVVHSQSFSSGGTGAAITTNRLQPGVDYVLIVTGAYTSKDHGIFSDVNMFTKIFKTDELGLSIAKVQTTEDSIMVKVAVDDESLVSSYGLALYLGDDDKTNLTTYAGNTFTETKEFIFKKDTGLNTGLVITPDTEYKVQLTNIVVYADEEKNSYSNVGADVSEVVKTLKVKPYYLLDDNITKEQVSDKKTKILTSSRYRTATVSLDTAIFDDNNGITGYRYELYETATDSPTITSPVQVKEVQKMETVTFNIEPDKRYFARVVVLFNDNEKLVELVSNPSDIVSLTHNNYPTVQFINVKHEYDKVYGYVMVEDKSDNNQDMLLGHTGADYPLILTITAQVGDMHTIKLYEELSNDRLPEGYADSGKEVEYYYFEMDGLARDTTHTVSVSGYVNDTDMDWDQLSESDKKAKLQYLSGYNINVGSPTPILVKMRSVPNVGDDLFTVALAFTDENGEDASYEVANMEKISFRLVNASGVTIGTTANMMDINEENHASDYSNFYSSHITTPDAKDLPYSAVENQSYSQYVLTDESFGAKGDLRIANGGDFKIYVESAYDYTQDDVQYPKVTNELDISGEVTFEVKKSHTRVPDPNDAVSVVQILNKDAKSPVSGLEEDTVVGLTVDTGYSLPDAHKVTYYIYEVTSADTEPLILDDNPADVLEKSRNDGYWGSNKVTMKTKTVNVTTAENAGGSVLPWTVYFNQTDAALPNANIDDDGNIIFERGKVYFIRYEVLTDGTMEDTLKEKRYPHCAYDGLSEMQVPFYRSNVFGIERQTPVVQRYIWDTVTTNGSTIQTWKYKLNDPDNAILAYAQKNTDNISANIVQYPTFEEAFAVENGSATTLSSLKVLYDEGTKLPKSGYESVIVSGLEDGKWYTIEVPYCLFEANTKADYEAVNKLSILSVPSQVKAVDDIVTEIADVNNSTTDYAVNGVMIKDVADVKGVNDEYGYRIKMTLQGSQVDRVAALKVTVKGVDDNGVEKTVVYDPVAVTMQNGTNGPGANTFAYGFLEYGPIVNAGINHRTVTISAEAYYTTYRVGMSTFAGDTGVAHSAGFTASDNQFANANAWALKQYDYEENNGITSYTYAYQMITDSNGNLQPSVNVYKDASNTDIVTRTLNRSVFIPQMSGDGTANIGFDENNLKFNYALSPIAYTKDGTFADVMYGKTMPLTMDEVGAKGMNGSYYVMEQLARKPLKIDFGDAATDYYQATFVSGDGMPGISFNTSGSSTGMSSATVQFDIKGKLPGTDKGYYLYLYPEGSSDKIALEKWKDADGNIYYLVVGASPTTDQDIKVSTADDNATYALEPDATGEKVTFAIRGLNRSTTYQVKIKGRDAIDKLQDLFDFTYENGGRYYPFKTTSMIKLNSSNVSFVYNSYNDKFANLNYAVEGSEGTGMRIFYKVYDEAGQEVKCGMESYDNELGYRLEPLGNNVKYYQSDMTLCNPVKINFKPGTLAMDTNYTVEYRAYVSTNAGIVLDKTEPIGVCSQSFKTPASLAAPRVSMRVVSAMDSLSVTVVLYDAEKAVYNDAFFVDVYDLAGNKVSNDSTQLKFTAKPGQTSTVATGKLEGLSPNQIYRVVVSAQEDRNNDGTPEKQYINELTGSTISTASATVSTSYTSDKLTFKLMDLANFDSVDRIVYSIDSQDGSTNYENVDSQLSKWTVVGKTYSYTTGFTPESGTYHYTLQFYNGTSLVGSTSGYFTK